MNRSANVLSRIYGNIHLKFVCALKKHTEHKITNCERTSVFFSTSHVFEIKKTVLSSRDRMLQNELLLRLVVLRILF